jgi:hypothetical protein
MDTSGGVTASLDHEETNNNLNHDTRSDPYLEIELYLKKVTVSLSKYLFFYTLAPFVASSDGHYSHDLLKNYANQERENLFVCNRKYA